jgi:hypothetical protein
MGDCFGAHLPWQAVPGKNAPRNDTMRLVHENINLAITREKQIKGGSRQKKLQGTAQITEPKFRYFRALRYRKVQAYMQEAVDLINNLDPEWNDLYEETLT